MDKSALATQLVSRIRDSVATAERERAASVQAARYGADSKTRREDTRMALEYSALAKGQKKQAQAGRQMLDALQTFRPAPARPGEPVRIGSLVEIEDDDTGQGRTVFLAPAGAGVELTGPGGDGFFTVVTPRSPIGRAILGQEVDDTFDITVDGTTRSWVITWIG